MIFGGSGGGGEVFTVFIIGGNFLGFTREIAIDTKLVAQRNLRSRGRGFDISLHLCKDYARSATTYTDNTLKIYERAL